MIQWRYNALGGLALSHGSLCRSASDIVVVPEAEDKNRLIVRMASIIGNSRASSLDISCRTW